MKVPMQWMRQYTEIPVSAEAFQNAMIMHGTGVEGLEDQNEAVQNVVVGRILSVRKHENSDHMVICSVDVGEAEPLQIVTGAPNVHEGDLVPVAKIGAVLPGGIKIKKGKLRGVESCGMCCSGPEIGVPDYLYPSVGDKGLLIFHEDYAPGSDVRPILGVDDTIVDFEILANRPDCLSVWGVAREAAVTLGTKFNKPEIKVETVPGRMSDFVHIDVQDTDLCPRYCARIIKNVKIGPSPMWMRKALAASGVRAINNIVDITNYVMLETGHPMHAFDMAKVKDQHIIVRRANEGETIVTLDGKERALTTDMLMIADQTNATGIAGVMGGEESEITEETTTVMFEIAAFDRTNIRLTTRALGLRTEASGRFERGVCAATCREAADRACQLVNLLGAGEVIEDVYDCYPNPRGEQVVTASVARINARIGLELPGEKMAEILTALDMKVTLDGDTLTAIAPDFREDIENEADLSEEVLRIYGYEHIHSTLLRGETAPGTRNEHMRINDKIGRILSGKGLYEIRNFSFISPKLVEKLGLEPGDPRLKPLEVTNPLGEDTSVMRATLVPSMLGTLSLNQSRNNETAMLYEIGPVFDITDRKPGELPHEQPTLCIGAYGEKVDFYLIRDIVLDLLARFGVSCEIVPGAEPYHHPGRAARLMAGETCIASVAEVHPDVMATFELSRRSVIAEINLELLAKLRTKMGHVHNLPKFPAVTRDIALVMDESVTVGSVLTCIRKHGGAMLEKAEMFDIYRGAQLLTGKKSVAFSLTFRNAERTLSDDDVNPVMQKILTACERDCGASLRV
ncbi:MAG: phenylalanine--tRNA ligase subunit beta [Clostridiales bacterium]|nr:phenylalanine--tRNA ligase subunit beta [Clostridiales bacterium]